MVGMNAVGTLSYNGYTFDGTARITCRVEFEYDSAERAVLYHRHIIRAEATIASAASTTDTEMADIRARLSKVGQRLDFVNKGFGNDLVVNAGGSLLNDVNFGPKPRVIEWEPIAGAGAAYIVWEVEVCVPVCDGSGIHRTTGVMSFNYDIDFDIDRGWTTRTISGSLRIAQTRISAGAGAAARIADTADNYREWIRAGDQAPAGFERRSKWTTSEDKSTLTFSIVDTQIRGQNVRPPGVVDISGEHVASWRRAGKGGVRLFNRLSMDIELLPTMPKITGFLMFSAFLDQKLRIARDGGKGVMLEEMQIREDIWGMPTGYSAGYTIFKGIDELIQGTGLFVTPTINAASWGDWSASIRAANGQRGFIGMRDFAQNDVIVDMCTTQVPTVAQSDAPAGYRRDRRPVAYKNEPPPPERSYLDLQNGIIVEKKMPAVRQSPQQYPYQSALSAAIGSATGGAAQGTIVPPVISTTPQQSAGMQFSPAEKKQYDDTIQLSGGGNTTITMIGWAERAGYEVPRPSLNQFGGLSISAGHIVETDVKFSQQVKAVYFGLPVYQAAWYITYMLSNTPINAPTPNSAEAIQEGTPRGWYG